MGAQYNSIPIGVAKYCDNDGTVHTISCGRQNSNSIFVSKYLCLSPANSNITTDIFLRRVGNPNDIVLYISTDNGMTWRVWHEISYQDGRVIAVGGEEFPSHALISGHGSSFSVDANNYYKFSSEPESWSGNFTVSGDVHSLIGFADVVPQFCFYKLFNNCTKMTGSTPSFGIATLGTKCYANMFDGCTGITSASSLRSTTLGPGCYDSMFVGCSSLVMAPTIYANTIESLCYQNMFKDCTSLVTAPNLIASTPVIGCYHTMFLGCSSLSSVSISLTTSQPSPNMYMRNWLINTAESGTFHCTPSLKNEIDLMGRSAFSIPSGWTILSDVIS